MDCAESGSPMTINGDDEMKIILPEYYENYALEVENSNTVEDELSTILPIQQLNLDLKSELHFNEPQIDVVRFLAEPTFYSADEREWPNKILEKKKIIIVDRPLAIWEKEHDKILLGLLVEQIRNEGRKILDFENDSLCDVVAKFNEATCVKYDGKHLHERFNFYKYEYEIVNNMKHHPEFSWDHQRQVVIATDAKWDEYIKENPNAKRYRRRVVPYFDLLEILFAEKKE